MRMLFVQRPQGGFASNGTDERGDPEGDAKSGELWLGTRSPGARPGWSPAPAANGGALPPSDPKARGAVPSGFGAQGGCGTPSPPGLPAHCPEAAPAFPSTPLSVSPLSGESSAAGPGAAVLQLVGVVRASYGGRACPPPPPAPARRLRPRGPLTPVRGAPLTEGWRGRPPWSPAGGPPSARPRGGYSPAIGVGAGSPRVPGRQPGS